MSETEPGSRSLRGRRRSAGLLAGAAALVASLGLARGANATTFVYSTGFGASGISNTLHGPLYDAIDSADGWVYVSESQGDISDGSAVSAVERFNLDGTPAPFTAGDVTGNVLGLSDVNQNQAVFRTPSTVASASSFDCATQSASSTAGIACFDVPHGIAVAPQGVFFVGNYEAETVEVFSSSGQYLSQIGPDFGVGSISNTTSGTGFDEVNGIAYDSTNNLLFVADGQGEVWVFHSDGAANPTLTFVTKLGSSGSGANQWSDPQGIATDSNASFWVADEFNSRVTHWTYSYGGGSFAAAPATDSPYVLGGSDQPVGITYTAGDGGQTPPSIFVTDQSADQVLQYLPTGSRLASFGSHGGADGQFETPYGVAALPDDGAHGTNLYIVDNLENQVDDFIPSPPVNSAAPTISGTPQVGQTLSASTGTWANVSSTSSYTYNWMQCDASGSNCVSVQNGAADTLALTSGFSGSTVKVGVYANNGQLSQEAISTATAVIAAAATATTSTPTPTVSTRTPTPVETVPSPANTKVTSAPSRTTSTTALSATGQSIKVSVVPGSSIVLQLILDKKTAKAVGLGNGRVAVVVGQRTLKDVKGKTATIKAIMTPKARRALSKLHRTFKLTLRTTFSLAGHKYVVNRVETVNRPKPKQRK